MPANLVSTTVYDGSTDDVLSLSDFLLYEYHIGVLPHPSGACVFSVWAKASVALDVEFSIFGNDKTVSVGTSWQRVTIKQDDDGTGDAVLVRPQTAATLYLYKAQLEQASTESDWRAAPEDEEAALSDGLNGLNAKTDAINDSLSVAGATANNANSLAQQAMMQADANADGIVQVRQIVSSSVEQLRDSITNRFTEALEYSDNSTSDIRTYVETAQSYQRFDANGIELGKSNSPFKANLTNTELAFSQNGEKVAYINNNTMHITNAEVTTGLKIGYFQFKPTETGMALIYVG